MNILKSRLAVDRREINHFDGTIRLALRLLARQDSTDGIAWNRRGRIGNHVPGTGNEQSRATAQATCFLANGRFGQASNVFTCWAFDFDVHKQSWFAVAGNEEATGIRIACRPAIMTVWPRARPHWL